MKVSLKLYLHLLLAVAGLLSGCDRAQRPAAASAKPGWLTSYEQAREEAKSKHKLLLLDFTGSDWCAFCIKLDREVFSKTEFSDYARNNLVLLEVDFPRGKEQSGPERKQNYDLQERFGIQAYPTLIVLDSNGKVLGELGYDAGVSADAPEMIATPETFIASIEKLREG